MLMESLRLSAEAGNPELAFSAADAIAERFEDSALLMKEKALQVASKESASRDDHARLAKAYLALAGLCAAEDDFSRASSSLAEASRFALKSGDRELSGQVREERKRIERLGQEYDSIRPAKAVLARTPSDPEANTQAGRYYCFLKQDWQTGLPMLAKGKDQSLKMLAAEELGSPGTAKEWFNLAEGWWKQSEKEEGDVRLSLRNHAGDVYKKAVSGLDGIEKKVALARIAEAEKTEGTGEQGAVPGQTVLGAAGTLVGNPTTVGHRLQVWRVQPEQVSSGLYRLRIQHAAAGMRGAFFMTAWVDTKGDGVPDRQLGRSPLAAGRSAGDWSEWSFRMVPGIKALFVGNGWGNDATVIFYQSGGRLAGYEGLDSTMFFSQSDKDAPTRKTGPRYTNIQLIKAGGK
jgi:hypothetical protein